MKNLFFFLVVIFLHHPVAAQQSFNDKFNYKAVYELTYQPDSTDASSVTSEEMWLYLGNDVSKFSSRGHALKDSLDHNKKITGVGMTDFKARIELTRTEFDYAIYKDLPEDHISYTLQILRDKLRYEEDKDVFDWEILPETRTIKGYETQKAKTVFRAREYTAWFTTEIPISDGPYKFNGLPGLILELSDSSGHYIFELAEFKTLEPPVLFSLETKDYILTSRDELLQQKRKYEEDPFAALDNANRGSSTKVTIGLTKQQKREHLKQIREELEKKNNPIELK